MITLADFSVVFGVNSGISSKLEFYYPVSQILSFVLYNFKATPVPFYQYWNEFWSHMEEMKVIHVFLVETVISKYISNLPKLNFI